MATPQPTRKSSVPPALPSSESSIRVKSPEKECSRCRKRYPIEDFEGCKRCSKCREGGRKNFAKLMRTYKAAGVRQKIPLSDLEYDRMLKFFGYSCAFCGEKNMEKVQVTRLLMPILGGGDDLWNIIPSCQHCLRSRRGLVDWRVWIRVNQEIYSPKRLAKLEAWNAASTAPPPSVPPPPTVTYPPPSSVPPPLPTVTYKKREE